ncbi:MAG: CHAT domain-containing protein [Acidobacteriaceae bacterium]|nr:CHAT domain-containing protein [Acidobacteriaceae bacterium]
MLQSILRPGEMVIEYVLDEPHSYGLEITATRAMVHRLDGRKRVESAVDRYLDALRNRKDGSEEARCLYSALVGSVRSEHTPASADATTLIVVPDGKLHLLPFAALMGPDSKYLVESTAIFYAPSGNVLHVLRSERRGHMAPRPFLGVGYSAIDGVNAGSAEDLPRGLFEVGGTEYKPLAFAREEISDAVKVAGRDSVSLVGADASEIRVKKAHPADFRVLHFAAHAIESKQFPERAGLVFYPGDRSEDGLWQPREIRRESLQADLVVLSACETAVGKLEGEEGVANLARTFLVAGARSVVASTWRIQDRATATMMSNLYSYLGTGENVATALRHAQLELLKQFGSTTPPYFWAGFLVIGDGSTTISFGSPDTHTPTASSSLR